MNHVRIDVPIETPSTANGAQGSHWAVTSRRRKAQRRTVGWYLVVASRVPPQLPCTVTITRHSAGHMDEDNLMGATKSCRDATAEYLGADDGDGRITWSYRQSRCKRGEHAVTITIETKRGER